MPNRCSLGVRNGTAERLMCFLSLRRFHLPVTLNAKTSGSFLEVSVVPCPTGPQNLEGEQECPVDELSDSWRQWREVGGGGAQQ